MNTPGTLPGPPVRHVLALDGGGVRGIVTLHMLAAFERRFGVPAWRAFDFFAGTSTGAIIAALLAFRRLRAEEILAEYDRTLERVFERRPFARLLGGLLARRLYGRVAAENRLEELFGSRRLGELGARAPGEDPPALLLTTHDLVRNEELFLSNYPFRSGRPNFGATWIARDAVAASAFSAPWYFGPTEGRFVDGGVTVFNVPAAQAATEALDYCARPRFETGSTWVWSFGSGTFEEGVPEGKADSWHLWRWAARLFRNVHGDAEADQIAHAEALARRGEIVFRRYQVRFDAKTLERLGVSSAGVRMPIRLDDVAARDFLHRAGAAFARSIDWEAPRGVSPAPRSSPLEDPKLWRAPRPPAEAAAPPRVSARLE